MVVAEPELEQARAGVIALCGEVKKYHESAEGTGELSFAVEVKAAL